jgi:hypothetical protein
MKNVKAVMSDKINWVPVKWILLTEPNWVSSEAHYENVLEFHWNFVRDTSTALRFNTGIEHERENNMHSHSIVEVSDKEIEYFTNRFNSRGFSKYWKHRTMGILDYQFGYDTYGYTMDKHNAMPILTKCPKRLACCRKGRCPHML